MSTAADLAARLHPPRLPLDFAVFSLRDGVAAFGVGLLAGVVLFVLLRPFLVRRVGLRARVRRELAALRGLPSPERLFRQAAVHARLTGGAAGDAPWRAALYEPGGTVDHAALDAEILALAGRRAR